MLLAMDFRRQARVCARLAEECDDRRLAERLRRVASDLLAKADDFEEFPGDRASRQKARIILGEGLRRGPNRTARQRPTPRNSRSGLRTGTASEVAFTP